ncbi:MAG: hypothetical protein JXJ04_04250 [Spirochaetales bacterium]|nr:hypothetical protein [Spirochaetales bacterium]
MAKKRNIVNINIIQLLKIIFIVLALINIITSNHLVLSVVLLAILLLLHIIDYIICSRKSRQLKIINHRIGEETEKGLAHLIELQFNVKIKGDIGDLAQNLNTMLQEVKKVFWEIKENLFTTKISKNTLDNIQILMISYIQKVVNIGSVRTQLEEICTRINKATSSTKLILGSIIELANHTNAEAVTIKQTSNALAKLLQTISDISQLTMDKQKMAGELRDIARIGNEKVGRTTEIIQRINENTGEMLKIIEIINNIADSTNILSINAGIEAAHAGKEGKGFRVIADEIIKLVNSTKKNAGEISALLKDQVGKMTLALEESKISGDVLRDVNKEVKNAADTWVEISQKTVMMSEGTQAIQETTENIFEITKAVSESSEAIKHSVQKINEETSGLDEATSKTLDILEKVTVTNEEAKQSTVTILQQLNEMTKFVNKLNKAIDFFNLGKRVFFLFVNDETISYAKAILRKEYDVYHTNEYQILLKIVKEYSNSIILINVNLAPVQFNLFEYINTIKKIPDSKNISIAIPSYDKSMKNESSKDQCEYIFLNKKAPAQNIGKITDYINNKKAKGLRKQVRVICSEKDQVNVHIYTNNTRYTGKVQDISSGAILVSFPKDTPIKSFKRKFEFIISFTNKEYKITGESGLNKPNNNYLIILSDRIETDVLHTIYDFIFDKLNERLKLEIAKAK